MCLKTTLLETAASLTDDTLLLTAHSQNHSHSSSYTTGRCSASIKRSAYHQHSLAPAQSLSVNLRAAISTRHKLDSTTKYNELQSVWRAQIANRLLLHLQMARHVRNHKQSQDLSHHPHPSRLPKLNPRYQLLKTRQVSPRHLSRPPARRRYCKTNRRNLKGTWTSTTTFQVKSISKK